MVDKLSYFDETFVYIPGIQHVASDILSQLLEFRFCYTFLGVGDNTLLPWAVVEAQSLNWDKAFLEI